MWYEAIAILYVIIVLKIIVYSPEKRFQNIFISIWYLEAGRIFSFLLNRALMNCLPLMQCQCSSWDYSLLHRTTRGNRSDKRSTILLQETLYIPYFTQLLLCLPLLPSLFLVLKSSLWFRIINMTKWISHRVLKIIYLLSRFVSCVQTHVSLLTSR